MADNNSGWASSFAEFVNKAGAPVFFMVFVLLMASGLIPSVMVNKQDEILLVVKQIRTVSASVAGMRYAECVNKADMEAGVSTEQFDRMARRCHTAYNQLQKALEELGGQATGQVEFQVQQKGG